MTQSPERSEIRAATFLAFQARLDAPGRSRTGKTRRNVKCTPPNKLCGNRCIPPNWDCRLKGQGADNHTNAHKTDPLAGIASLQRGAKDLARGIATINPSRVQRGRSSVIRGVVKLTPGDDLEQKKRLKRRLTDASTPIAAVIGVTLVGLGAHAGLKRGFASYRRGVGADVDQAAARAVDSILDRMPGTAGPRATARATAAAAANDITTSALRGARIQSVRQATSGNTRRIGPLSFRPNAANYESSHLARKLQVFTENARNGGLSYDQWQRSGVQALYGAESVGTRINRQPGSVFSEHAANEFLVSKFGLSGQGTIGSNGSFSMSARNTLVEQQLGDRLGSWGKLLRDDMQLRRYTSPTGEIRSSDISRYIREVGKPSVQPRVAKLSAPQRQQISGETTRLMQTVITGDALTMSSEARSMRRALVAEYDTYFADIAEGMQRNAAASDSPFGDGVTGLARYLTRTAGKSTPILSRDHSDLILRHYYHTKVMKLNNNFIIGEGTARRVAQQISRSPDLPDVDTAYRILKDNGFPRIARNGSVTGRAPRRKDSLSPRVRSYLEVQRRLDFQTSSQGTGKPCGRSFIPKSHKCGETTGTTSSTPAQASQNQPKASTKATGSKVRTAVTVAAITGAAALTAGSLFAYKNRSTLVPTLSQQAIEGLSAQQVRQAIAKLPENFRDPVSRLVGSAKLGVAHMALKVQGAQIRAVDIDNNFSTWSTPSGGHISIGSVGDSLLTFGAERKADVGKFQQFGLGFTVDTKYDAGSNIPSKQAKQLIRTTKSMYNAQLEMLPDDAFLFAVPHKADGKGGKRKSIYEKMGFKTLPGLKGDKLWALKNQGKFTEIPDNQFEYISNMIRGDAEDELPPRVSMFLAAKRHYQAELCPA